MLDTTTLAGVQAASAAVTAQPAVKVTVKPGDTVSAIAAANGLTTKEVLAMNPALTSNPKYNGGNTIFSGTQITVKPAVKAPAATSGPAPTPNPTPTPEPTPTPTPTPGGETGTGTGTDTGTGTGTGTDTGTGTGGTPEGQATSGVQDQIDALNRIIAGLQSAQNAANAKPATPTVVGQKTVRKLGGMVDTVNVMSDGTEVVTDTYKDMGAADSVKAMFNVAGLDAKFSESLNAVIDKVYAENIMPTDAQILNSVYNSDAYKTRFAANEIIKKRIADGKGLPGDALLLPADYIKTEDQIRNIMSNAGLPAGFYDTPEDFTNFIANSVSPSEITSRVNIAKQALQNADQATVDALKNYYGWTTADLTAYLLDSQKAFDLVNARFTYTTPELEQKYGAAQVGALAANAGFTTATTTGMGSEAFATEIYKAGKTGQAEAAFQSAKLNQSDYSRLLGLSGQTAGEQDLAREQLGLAGGTDVGLTTKKLASAERARFKSQSAIGNTSLIRGRKSRSDV